MSRHFHWMRFCAWTASLSLVQFCWFFSPSERTSLLFWLITAFRSWRLTVEMNIHFHSMNHLTIWLKLWLAQNLNAVVPCLQESLSHFFKTLPRNKNMASVVFCAGWELHFLMELPFGWIWQEPILTNTGNEGTFTLFPSVFSFLPNYRIQHFWSY